MSILSTLGAELKALHKFSGPRDVFARHNSYRTGPYGVGSHNGIGGALISQSATLDLDRLVPDPLQNGVVAACVNAIARALPDAPLLLEHRSPSGWEVVDDHPCLQVLRAPNPDHSDADVWGLTSGFKATRGQAFWLLLPDTRGEVGEIHVWNPDRVTVLGDEDHFIAGYRVQRESGTFFEADKRQIIHFRHLPDFHNPRLGWNPLRTGRAQIAGDNISAGYHTSILFNAGVVSLLISLKEGAMSGQVTPEQFQTVLTNIRRAGRERAGSVEGINLPLEVHKLAYSPDEMNVDKLIEYFETRICSVMGVSQRVAGLGSDPTYNNLSEALNDFWERRIVPDRNADAATLNRQWLPLWHLDDGNWRFRFDYSEVPALQENRDALHARVRADWEKGLVDKQQARAMLGYGTSNDGAFERVFYGEKAKTETEAPEGELSQSQLAQIKALLWEESKHPRDEKGRFAGGISVGTPVRPSGIDHGRGGLSEDPVEFMQSSGTTGGSSGSQQPSKNGAGRTAPRQKVRTGSALETHLLQLLSANTTLTAENRENYEQDLADVAARIPLQFHSFIIKKVRFITAFNNTADLNAYGEAKYNQNKAFPRWNELEGAVAAWIEIIDKESRLHNLGGELIIDGAGIADTNDSSAETRDALRTYYIMHEFGHVLDRLPEQTGGKGRDTRISSRTDWIEAFEKEIKNQEVPKNADKSDFHISERAMDGANEAFAEVVASLWLPEHFEKASNPLISRRYCNMQLPECYSILVDEKIV